MECKGPPYIQPQMSSRSSVLEDVGADAGDEDDPELLKVEVAVQSAQHLLRRDEDARASRGA
jgi:hypothetical protein